MIPRPEHPRPDLFREKWLNLNGEWSFDFDGLYMLKPDTAMPSFPLKRRIQVPFPYQSRLSGIGSTAYQPCVWYERAFEIPQGWLNGRVLLHFGAVDYHARVWMNGAALGDHRGGHVPFTFDVTRWCIEGCNRVVVRAIDTLDAGQPRGKQAMAEPAACWYTQTTGIWQTVWLESVPETYIASVRVTADPRSGDASFIIRPNQAGAGLDVRVEVSLNGELAAEARVPLAYPSTAVRVAIPGLKPWSPEDPVLYDASLSLLDGSAVVDRAASYFGARVVSIERGRFCLDGRPYRQRLVLDQGFWPDGLYTAPTDDAFKVDIELARRMGFNGCRKHQKVEDPRFLYWADRLGFLVWGEFPAPYEFSLPAQARFLPEWQAAVERDVSHPSIVAWVPYNESWGIPRVRSDPDVQAWVRYVVACTRFMDPTRLVVDNDGWEHVDSDILGYHTYAPTGGELERHLRRVLDAARGSGAAEPGAIPLMADGVSLTRMPVMLTEFGGIGFRTGAASAADAWGYADIPETAEAFHERLDGLFRAAGAEELDGFVYTQLTDVQQEINGLLAPDRTPKVDMERVRQAVTRP